MSGNNDIFLNVYDSMLGLLEDEYALPWVADLCYPGSEYCRAYDEMLGACQRLCDRLGGLDDDGDVETVRRAYERMQELLARQMFAAGAAYAGMKNCCTDI